VVTVKGESGDTKVSKQVSANLDMTQLMIGKWKCVQTVKPTSSFTYINETIAYWSITKIDYNIVAINVVNEFKEGDSSNGIIRTNSLIDTFSFYDTKNAKLVTEKKVQINETVQIVETQTNAIANTNTNRKYTTILLGICEIDATGALNVSMEINGSKITQKFTKL
jgi:hypothetical protein